MFGKQVKLMTLAGFEVKIDASWLIIATLIVWSLWQGYFPATAPGLTSTSYLVLGVIGMLGLFASLILHELSHSLMARRYGLDIEGITLFLFGGVAELSHEPQSAKSEFWIAVAGPAMSLALSLMFFALSLIAAPLGLPVSVTALLIYLATINLALLLFNLLPAFPSDGGRVLRAALWQRSGNLLEATRQAAGTSTIVAYGLIALGLYLMFSTGDFGGLWLVLIALFLLGSAKAAYQQLLMKTGLHNRRVRSLMTPEPITVAPSMTLGDLADEVMLRHSISFVPVVEDGVLLGSIDTRRLAGTPREEWATTEVGDVFEALTPDLTVSPDMPAQALTEQIARTGRRKFLVVEDRALKGVVTLTDLSAFFTVLQEIGGPRAA